MELENKIPEDGKRKIISYFFDNNILISKDLLNKIREEDINELFNKSSTVNDPNLLYQELLSKIKPETQDSEANVKVIFSYEEKKKKKKGYSRFCFIF